MPPRGRGHSSRHTSPRVEVHHTCDWIAVPVRVKDAEPAEAGRQAQGNQNGDLHVIKASYFHFLLIKLKDDLMRVR